MKITVTPEIAADLNLPEDHEVIGTEVDVHPVGQMFGARDIHNGRIDVVLSQEDVQFGHLDVDIEDLLFEDNAEYILWSRLKVIAAHPSTGPRAA